MEKPTVNKKINDCSCCPCHDGEMELCGLNRDIQTYFDTPIPNDCPLRKSNFNLSLDESVEISKQKGLEVSFW